MPIITTFNPEKTYPVVDFAVISPRNTFSSA